MTSTETENKFIKKAQNTTAALAVLITALLPLKFGSIVAIPEVAGFYPDQTFAWIIVNWPIYLFPVFSGILLLFAMLCFPFPQRSSLKPAYINLSLWLLLPVVATIGFINASVMDFPIIETIHLTGIACWGGAIWLILTNSPEYRQYFYIAIIASVAITLLLSLEQYLSGFEETRKFMEAQEKRTGMAVHHDIDYVMKHNPRVFGPFGLCNSLAAHLLLTIPLCLALLWQWCGKIDPPKISRTIFIIPFTAFALFILYHTGSRAALLAVVAAAACFSLCLPINYKIKILTVIGGLTFCIGGVIAMKYMNRTFTSIIVRVDYLLRSAEIFIQHPLAGSGWGDFFHDYMTIKEIFHKEAPHTPHNIIMAFTAQTGIVGFLAITAALLYPIAYGAKQLNKQKHLLKAILQPKAMILLGIVAWTIHAMADINLQIPATMATVVLMMVILVLPCESNETTDIKQLSFSRKCAWRLIACIFAGAAIYGGMHQTKFDYSMSKLGELCDVRTKSREEFFLVQPDSVMQQLAECNKLAPYSPYPYRTAAAFMAGRGYLKQSQMLYLEALKRSPERGSIYFQLYLLNRADGKRKIALEYLVKAIKMFPKNEKYLKAALQEGIVEQSEQPN